MMLHPLVLDRHVNRITRGNSASLCFGYDNSSCTIYLHFIIAPQESNLNDFAMNSILSSGTELKLFTTEKNFLSGCLQ